IVSFVTIRMVKQLKNLTTSETTYTQLKIMYWFFSHPDKGVSLSDIASELRISKTIASISINYFVNEGFLKKEVFGRTWRISCNKEHPLNSTLKVSYNLGMIYSSPIISEIHKMIPNSRAIVLFGSYRKGDDTEKSDIDIAVEVLSDEKPQIIELGLVQMGYRKNVLVNLHVFSRNKVDLNLFANIANGIVLEGFLEVRP
ncbi:MAG: nucleotidyltransferase domain-containing protein, partial [Candidatus Aenigmarchaeota archaeon]|nr:nucleotidyltransferase domain-containing protein [Candidatus Aenigmarchaeota archaeon]